MKRRDFTKGGLAAAISAIVAKAATAAPFVVVSGPRGGTGVGGGGASSYTATHYVDVYTNVSGSPTDDNDIQESGGDGGAAAFAAATNSETPCTLGCAMENAVAGNQVQVAAGFYDGQDNRPGIGSLDRFYPSFRPTNSGTASEPIVFFAQYPAAENYGSPSLYSKIGHIDYEDTGAGAMGANSVDYIVFDGFFLDEADARVGAETGIMVAWTAENIWFRRCVFDRGDGALSYASGTNGNALHLEHTDSVTVEDCIFTGYVWRNPPEPAVIHQNLADIQTYHSTNLLIRHCEWSNAAYCIFQKATADDVTDNSMTVEYCSFEDVYAAIASQMGSRLTARHNLIVECDTGVRLDGPNLPYSTEQVFDVQYNTIVLAVSMKWDAYPLGIAPCTGYILRNSYCRNNIVYAPNGVSASGEMFSVLPDGSAGTWDWSDFLDLDHNCYYREDAAALQFTGYDLAPVVGITDWRTETSQEAATITTDPEFVGGGDYRLADNGQDARSASHIGGLIGCYVDGTEEIGVRASPSY